MSTEEIALRKIVRGNLEKIEFAYQRAVEDGVTDVAVLVIDLRDRRGRQIAEALYSKAEVYRHLDTDSANELDLWLIEPLPRNETGPFLAPFISPTSVDGSSLTGALVGGQFAIGVITCNILGWTTHRIPDCPR
jgi:hypothetical protein